jgi:hypothetical protein
LYWPRNSVARVKNSTSFVRSLSASQLETLMIITSSEFDHPGFGCIDVPCQATTVWERQRWKAVSRIVAGCSCYSWFDHYLIIGSLKSK